MKISESKKRKECPEFDDEDEEKMDKFYELIRNFKDHASQLVFNSLTNMPKNTETTQQELVEKIELKKNKNNKKAKTDDDKKKEDDKSSLFFTSPSQAFTRSSSAHTTRNSPNSDGTNLDVNVMSGYRVSGNQIHDETQGLDLNLSL